MSETGIDIYRAEKIAQDRWAESDEWDRSFTMKMNGTVVSCEWLDPYFGIFRVEGSDGFCRTKDVPAEARVFMPEG